MQLKKGFPQAISKTFSPVKTYLAGNLTLLKKVKRLDLWVVGTLALLAFIVFVPKLQVSEKITDADKAFQIENEARKTILQGLGGGFFFVTAYFAWRQVQVAEKNRETAEKTRQVTEDKQVSERFVKAVEMLADTNGKEKPLDMRLGAIYSLERIARDSPGDHWPIAELLAAYVRRKVGIEYKGRGVRLPTSLVDEETEIDPDVPEDIVAALRTITLRQAPKDQQVNLPQTYLVGADIRDARLCGANLRKSYLSRVCLNRADLSEAYLFNAKLDGAELEHATLFNAILSSSDLRDASFKKSGLHGVDLSGAELRYAFFDGADLSGAYLEEACLSGTSFNNADLNDAYLVGCSYLTVKQVKAAKNWYKAVFSPNFVDELRMSLSSNFADRVGLLRNKIFLVGLT